MKKKKPFSVAKRPWHRQFIKTIVVLCNLLVALGMLLGGLSLWIGSELLPHVNCFGLVFPIFLLLNLLFVVFWVCMRDAWCLVSLVFMLLLWTPIKNTISFNQTNEEHEQTETISVLSYNTMACSRFAWHTKAKPNQVLQYIIEQDADVVCLQEFGVTKNNLGLQLADVKKALAAYKYSHIEYTINNKRKSVGVATFSKYPIVNKANLDIDSRFNMAIASDVCVHGDTLRVFNCHLESNKLTENDVQMQSELVRDFNTKRAGVYAGFITKKLAEAYQLRAKQARQVAKAVKESPYPVLLCGDFNDVPTSYTYNTIRTSKHLKDAFVEAGNGLGFTYQKNLMHVRIDYIMYDDYFCSVKTKVDKNNYSDHYPIYCSIYKNKL